MTPLDVGLEQGLDYLVLSFFTTLATPSAAAYVLFAVSLIACVRDGDERKRAMRFAIVPLGIGIVGFIISSAHLGRPSNVLYVLTGTGRSPLSNEIFCAVIYFGAAYVHWFASFSERVSSRLLSVVMGLACVCAVFFIAGTANAYHVRTILTWDLPYTQVNLVLACLMGGSVIALLSLRAAQVRLPQRWLGALAGLGALSSVGALVSQLAQYAAFSDVGNSMAEALELVPFCYGASVVSFVLAAVSLALVVWPMLPHGAGRVQGAATGKGDAALEGALFAQPSLMRLVVACALMLTAVFVVRFVFYCAHLTAGISL